MLDIRNITQRTLSFFYRVHINYIRWIHPFILCSLFLSIKYKVLRNTVLINIYQKFQTTDFEDKTSYQRILRDYSYSETNETIQLTPLKVLGFQMTWALRLGVTPRLPVCIPLFTRKTFRYHIHNISSFDWERLCLKVLFWFCEKAP